MPHWTLSVTLLMAECLLWIRGPLRSLSLERKVTLSIKGSSFQLVTITQYNSENRQMLAEGKWPPLSNSWCQASHLVTRFWLYLFYDRVVWKDRRQKLPANRKATFEANGIKLKATKFWVAGCCCLLGFSCGFETVGIILCRFIHIKIRSCGRQRMTSQEKFCSVWRGKN